MEKWRGKGGGGVCPGSVLGLPTLELLFFFFFNFIWYYNQKRVIKNVKIKGKLNISDKMHALIFVATQNNLSTTRSNGSIHVRYWAMFSFKFSLPFVNTESFETRWLSITLFLLMK